MPHQQTSATRRRVSEHGNHASQHVSSVAALSSSLTCERDDTYGLISVVYHALQGAETCAQYVEDARRSRNAALEAFFEEARVAQNDLAFKGKHLLAAQLEAALEDDELDDDAFDGDMDADEEEAT
jgi:hypothetical protein